MLSQKLLAKLSINQSFNNPKSGTSIIKDFSNEYILFERGNSKIKFPLTYLDKIYLSYKGTKLSTSDLHREYPPIFDSKKGGHSCNATFLFMMYEYLGLTKNGIEGDGVAHHPYYIELLEEKK